MNTHHTGEFSIEPLVIDIPDLEAVHGKHREVNVRALSFAKTIKVSSKHSSFFKYSLICILLSDWGGVCLCVESAPLGALVGVIVRNVE